MMVRATGLIFGICFFLIAHLCRAQDKTDSVVSSRLQLAAQLAYPVFLAAGRSLRCLNSDPLCHAEATIILYSCCYLLILNRQFSLPFAVNAVLFVLNIVDTSISL